MTTKTSILSLLGGFLFTVDGERREVPARKVKALICRLAFDDAPLSRETLAALLWPDSDPAAARHSLRQALSDLRRALQGSDLGLTVTSQEAALETYGGIIDVREFRTLAASGDPGEWSRAMTLYRGMLVEGLEARADTYDDWLAEARQALAHTALELCRALAEHHGDDAREGIVWTKRLLTLDPLDEAAHRNLMQLYIVADQDGAAIRQFLHCRSVLERELGIAPSADTTALYESLLRHRAEAGGARHSSAARSPGADAATAAAHPAGTAAAPSESAPAAPGGEPGRRLRPAVVLACQLPADEPDPEQADHRRRQILEQVTRVIRSYSGRVVAHVGSQIVCGFGLGRVRGTEADRACMAAAELVGAVAGLKAGIASGQVIFRPEDGSLVGQTATDAQDLAAQATAGTILMSEAVAAARRDGGRAEAVSDGVVRLVPGESGPDGTPLVGRALEIRQFVATLDASRDGGYGCAVLLRGEAGIGKSRLVQEYVDLAHREGFVVHHSQAYDFGTSRGQDPVAQLVRSLLGRDADDAPAMAARVGESYVPYLQAVLGVDPAPDGAGQLDSLSPFERLKRSTEAVVALVRLAARDSALVLVVDDLHWADRLTLAVLPRLARAAAELPVVLIMTSRVAGEALDPEWRAAMGGAPLVTLDLQPLRPNDAGLLANALGAGRERLAELLERAGGNPLFIQQLVRATRLGQGLPHSIQSLAVAELEALPEPTQAAVRAASVLGQHFTAETLQAVAGAADLEAAVEAGLVIRSDGGEWRFHHALIRDGIYHNVLPSERRGLHARAAAWFRDRSLTLHAQHLDLADAPEAVPALLTAATDEIDHYRLSRARQLVQRALERAPHEPRAMLIDAQLELVVGNTASAAEGFRACLRDAAGGDVRAHALVGLGMALNQMDDYAEAVAALREAVTLNTEDHAYQADAWLQLGNVLFPQGFTEDCLRAHQTSLEHAVQAGSTLRQARAEGGLGDAWYQQGAMLTAYRHFDRCVQIGEQHGHAGAVPANLAMRGLTLLFHGRARDALADAGRALELARQSTNLRHQLLAHNVLANVNFFLHDADAGLAHARSCLDLGQRIGSRRFVVDARCLFVQHLWSAGRWEEARRALEDVDQALDVPMLPFSGAYVRGLQALCATSARERHACLAAGSRLLDAQAVSHCHLYFYIEAMEACLGAGEYRQALGYADALADYTAREPLPLSDFFIRRARLLAGEPVADTAPEVARAELIAEARASGLMIGLRLLNPAQESGNSEVAQQRGDAVR